MRRIVLFTAALLALAAAPLAHGSAPLVAQGGEVSAAQVPVAEGAVVGSPAPEAAGFTRPAGPPRTLRGYWHLFIAFAVTWVLLFGYTVWVAARMGRLEREVEALQAGEARPAA